MDNNVVIGTKVDTEGVDKGITEIKRKFEDLDDIEVDVDDDLVLEGMTDRLRELHEELKQLENKHVIGDDERERIKEIKDEITAIIDKANEMTGQNYVFKGITDINTKVDTMGKSFEKIGKSVSHLGLKLLGVNSIYGLISSSITRMQGENPQFETFLQAIQNMLDVIIGKLINMIEPFLPRLLPMIEKLLTLIFEIVEALDKTLGPVLEAIIDAVSWIIDGVGWLVEQLLKLMGIDVSSETEQFAKDINEASKGLKKTNKEVQKLRKQLLGFDEMNVLNSETGSVGALGSTLTGGKGIDEGSSLVTVAQEVAKVADEVDEDMKDMMSFAGLLDKFGKYYFQGGFMQPFIKTTDFGEDLVKYVKQFNTFYDTARSVSEKNGMITIVGRTGETLKMTREEFDGLINDLNNKFISKKNLKSWLSVQKAFKDINVKRFSITQKAIAQGFKDATIEYKDGLVNVRLATGETITYTEEEFDKLKQYVYTTGVEIANDAAETGSQVEDNFWSMGEEGKDSADKAEEEWSNGANNIAVDVAGTGTQVTGTFWNMGEAGKNSADKAEKEWNWAFGEIEDNSGSVADGIVSDFEETLPGIRQAIEDNYPGIEQAGAGLGGAVSGAMVGAINKGLDSTETVMNKAIDIIRNLLKNMNLPGAVGAAQLAAAVASLRSVTLPRIKLAKGGIINYPGRGIPVAGERGREGVIPLTDSQQMEYLGREIAKHIVVNLTNVTELDGRQIARSITKVMQENQFASNGGVI